MKDDLWETPQSGNFDNLDKVLLKIKSDWPFILTSDFSPSTLALSLISGPDLSPFLQLHEALSAALQASVQAHFQSFAASLPAHANFLSTLNRAQQQVQVAKTALREAREGFGGKGKSELAGIRGRERQVRDMLEILDTM
jgi:exocyst complex component 4